MPNFSADLINKYWTCNAENKCTLDDGCYYVNMLNNSKHQYMNIPFNRVKTKYGHNVEKYNALALNIFLYCTIPSTSIMICLGCITYIYKKIFNEKIIHYDIELDNLVADNQVASV